MGLTIQNTFLFWAIIMDKCDVLIIGAGAAGLMAGYSLVKAGKKVTVLEARNRCGGRIHTLHHELFFKEAELGAEFVHGDLPLTLGLLKDAGIELAPSGGQMWHYKDGRFVEEGLFNEGWDRLAKRLKEIKKDVSINQFLEAEFPGEKYHELKTSVRRFASGYDTADPDIASTFALRDEWLEDEGAQHRIKGGYGPMIGYLEAEIRKAGGVIILNSVVKEIDWQPGYTKAATADGYVYEAEKLLIALPLGVLKAARPAQAAISFSPPITTQMAVISKMGFGGIIKILLEFDELFWEDSQTEAWVGKSLKNMGFVLSDEEIPTWWTQAPQKVPVLTGWLGGPAAIAKKNVTDEELLRQSLESVGNIFNRSIDELKGRLVAYHVVNWTNDPFALGSYAYDTVDAAAQREILNLPVEDTLYFAGEYLYAGPVMGTVEAALISGRDAAARMIGKN